MNPRELSCLVDHRPQVLPTFACVATSLHETEPPWSIGKVEIELSKV
jgi:hypothetical protein